MYELRAVCKTENTSEKRVKGTQRERERRREGTVLLQLLLFL